MPGKYFALKGRGKGAGGPKGAEAGFGKLCVSLKKSWLPPFLQKNLLILFRFQMNQMIKQEEEEVLDDLKELETYLASDQSEDESWGNDQEEKVAYEWQDFFAD